MCVCVCVCLSPRPDFRSKNIAEVITQRGFWMFRFKFCRAGVETLVRNGSFKHLADLKDKASLQTVFALIVSPFTEKQSSMSPKQKKQKRHRDFQDYNSRPPWSSLAVPRALNSSKYTIPCIHMHLCCCGKPHAHSDTQKGRQGFTGNRGSSSSFEGQPSQS